MADITSKYAGKRITVLKGLCKQKKIEFDPECDADDLASLLDAYDKQAEAEAQAEAQARKEQIEAEAQACKDQLEAEARKVEVENRAKIELIEAETRAKIQIAQAEKAKEPETPRDTNPAKQSIEEQKVLSLLKNLDEDADVDLYFDYFEKVLRTNNVPREKWGFLLAKVITGKALEAYTSLADEDLKDYDKVKSTILNRFSVGAEYYRKKFRNTTVEPNEGYAEFASRLSQNITKWLEKLGLKKSYDLLVQALLLEQFYDSLPSPLKVYLLDHKPATLNEAGSLAQQYTEHRNSVYGKDKTKVTSPKGQRKNPGSSQVENGETDNHPSKTQNGKSSNYRPAYQNYGRASNNNSNPSTTNDTEQRPRYVGCTICGSKEHRWSDCSQRKDVHLSSFSKEAGHQGLQNSEFNARVNGAVVESLYDTGASISLIERAYVKSHSFTGEKVHLRHAFSSEIITLPVAAIYIESEKFTGTTTAAVYTELPYPFILSPNSKCESGSVNVLTRAQAKREEKEVATVPVETQPVAVPDELVIPENTEETIPEPDHEESGGESEILTSPTPVTNPVCGPNRPNLASSAKALSHVTREEQIVEQQNDPELAKYYTYANSVNKDERAVKYSLQDGLIVGQWSKHGLPEEQKFNANLQIVVPTSLRARIPNRIHDFEGGHFKTHHPASQGAVEVLHRIIKNSLRAIIIDHPSSDWDQILPFVMFGIANSVNATLGFKPSELLFTRELRGPATITYDNWLESENTDCNLIELVLRQVNT